MKMDLKHKGISWVGNMFQKFEAVCQEVDNIINQDKVKYVENQVSSASANVKRLYSDVVQGLLPPMGDPMKYEAKEPVQRGHVPINAYFRSLSHNEGKAASNVFNKSSVGHDIRTIDQIDNRSQASCIVPFVNEEVAQVPNHSSLELNADLPLEKNDDVLLDKDLYENMKENAVSELLSEKNDGSLTDKLTLMESDASDPLSCSLSNVSTEINDTNKRASSVCDGFDMKLEDDVLLVGNDDELLTDKDESKSSEEDITMKFNASDPLKHMANCTSCEVKVTNEEPILILDNSHLPIESSRFLWKNDGDLSNENSDEFLKKVVTMEPNTADHLNENHLSHVWSGTNFVSKEADDSNLFFESVVLSARIGHAMMDKDFNKSPVKNAIFEDDPNSYLLNLPRHANGVSFTDEEAIMVFDRNDLELETEILTRKNDDALTVKYSNESLKNDTILELEHDANYTLKNRPRCTSSSMEYKNEEVSSVSNGSFLKLESEVIFGKTSKALIDKASDASCKKQANLELSTELTLHCGEESIMETLCSYGDECEGDIVTSNGNPQETSIHRADVESIHNEEGASRILVNNEEAIFDDGPNSYLLNLPRHADGISFTNKEAIMVFDRNHQQLATEILARKNDDALTVKYLNESLKNDTILELEHYANYPLMNRPRCTSSSIEYKNEEVSAVSNGSFLKLESEVIFGKNSNALIDKASDASCKEQANLELSTELTLHCGEESIKETLCSYGNESEGDIVTSNGNPQKTSIHCADVKSIHNVKQASGIVVNNSVGLSPRTETTSKYLENGVDYSSNAVDATSLVLTGGETVEETEPVSSLKPLAKVSFSAFRSLVSNLSNNTVIHEKPVEQNAYIECESRPSFEVIASPSYGNKASKMKFVSSKSSLSSLEPLAEIHASRANDAAFLPKFYTRSQGEFSKSTSSGIPSLSTEGGCPHDSSDYSKMETVDLGHKVTLEDESDVVDYKTLHAVSRRTQKLRSYKRIQDAFSSKKRLAKEYEQLAIWYGDTDLEFSTNNSQKLEKENASTSYVSDSEWEVL
ncbi:uncharacterized protein LOC120086024 isoform X2 [Benincasa hispida]|uniref:uncharacterized protein LOC120086024 isoform X2 n=1 Tax=Benincasa hispida TaxID=102211 RepID=UPI0019016869|nr:uncharacterized protein LOC120086024 isoform X2 [Benincasa hispida]